MGKKEDKKSEDILGEDVEAGAKAAAAAAEEADKEDVIPEEGVGIEQAAEDIITKMQQQEATIVSLEDQVKRQMAEFDNFRKRTEREKADMFDFGAIDVVKKLLPIVDNFERGFKTLPEGEEKTGFATGMEMVYKQMMKMFDELKVTPIEAIGKEFDPELHNAVQHVEKDDVGENIVVEEFEKGYKYKDTVIRHSMVIVAN
ncbi:nucleotide exchange factor GrpE [Howardella ureilytica]|nr:nucleotide exchange factor GrpE [Lachnospiraceae bacterium]MDY2956607.1 nucleotide exchange factor GrpE [Lachnospiraceae bacterium]